MSRKIIGITVGTPLPKPNFDQTDPSKGDYISGDRSFLKSVKTINGMSPDENGDLTMELDTTLTQSGVAADAKAVSDAIGALVGDIPVATQIAEAVTFMTDEEIDAICGNNLSLDISDNTLVDISTGDVYRIYVDDGKLSMKQISGASNITELIFVDATTDTVYQVYVDNGDLHMKEVI